MIGVDAVEDAVLFRNQEYCQRGKKVVLLSRADKERVRKVWLTLLFVTLVVVFPTLKFQH